jgi:hypothetical protein
MGHINTLRGKNPELLLLKYMVHIVTNPCILAVPISWKCTRILKWYKFDQILNLTVFFNHISTVKEPVLLSSIIHWNLHSSCVSLSLSLMLRPTVSRPVCLVVKHPSGAYNQIFITCVTFTVLFLWGALSDERSSLSFVFAVGPCQRSLSWVRVPWDLRPYFTVSHLSLPFSSPPTTRRVTVEVFEPVFTRVSCVSQWQIAIYIIYNTGESKG